MGAKGNIHYSAVLPRRKETPVSIEQETGWAPETVWPFWWRENARHCQVWIHRSSSQWYNHSIWWQISSNRHWEIWV